MAVASTYMRNSVSMDEKASLASPLWMLQEEDRLTRLVNQTLGNLQELQKSIQELRKEQNSKAVVGLLTRLGDNASISAINHAAKALFAISTVAVSTEIIISANTSRGHAKATLQATLDSIFYRILGTSSSWDKSKPMCIPRFKECIPTKHRYAFECLTFINTHALFDSTEWASRVSHSLIAKQSFKASLRSLKDVLKDLYSSYRLPLITKTSLEDSEGCFEILRDILRGTYQQLVLPKPQESYKKYLAKVYRQSILRYPPETFKRIDNIVDYVFNIAEQSRRAAYRFLCSLYGGKPEIEKALDLADKSKEVKILQFAINFLSPKERYEQCSIALERRCEYPENLPQNQDYQKSVIITLLGGGAISNPNFHVAPVVYPWLVEYNENVKCEVKMVAVTKVCLLPAVIDNVLIPYIDFVPPVQQPLVLGSQK